MSNKKKKLKKAIVWNEYIYNAYENGKYRCICGALLKDHRLSKENNEKLTIKRKTDLFCPKCNSKVAELVWIPEEDVTGIRMGDYDAYLKKKLAVELMD